MKGRLTYLPAQVCWCQCPYVGELRMGTGELVDELELGNGAGTRVAAVHARRAGYARMCYFAALADDPTLEGTITLRLTVDAKGEVEEVGAPKATMKAIAVEDCLERGAKGLRFTAPRKAPAMVDVTLTFERKS